MIYYIYLIETVQKNKESFTLSSQDLVISSLDDSLVDSSKIIGFLTKENDKLNITFKDHRYFNLLEKIGKILKENNFNVSVDPDFLKNKSTTLPQDNQVVSETPNKPKVIKDQLANIFQCPHLIQNENDDFLNSDSTKALGCTPLDSYNCLFVGKTCPLLAPCKKELLCALEIYTSSNNFDLCQLDFTNDNKEFSYMISSKGMQAITERTKIG